jgi:hypothetical protein
VTSAHTSAVSPAPPTRLEMPFLLLCAMGFCAFFAVVGTLAYLGILLSLLGDGPFTVNERPVTRAGFLAAIWPLLVALPPALASAAGVAYGLRRERPWSRPVLLGFGILNGLLSVGLALGQGDVGDVLTAGLWTALVVGMPAWYLYRKGAVVAYYHAVTAKAGVRDV